MHDVIELTQALCAIPSITGDEAAAQGFMPKVRWLIDDAPTKGMLVSAMNGVLYFERGA